MKEINVNAKGTATAAVNETNTAAAMGSGSLKVFATPAMVALMEASACNCLADFLDEGESTVGTALDIKHISATPVDMAVTAEATLTEVNGREFTFEVKAFDESGEIGCGTHKRFLVFAEKFTAKTYEKLNK